MRRWAAVALLVMSGCGGHFTPPPPPPLIPPPVLLLWKNDGNPGLPLCSAGSVGCKASYLILDATDNIVYTSVLALSQYTAAPRTAGKHTYNIMVNAVNPEGQPVTGPPLVLVR